MRCRQQRPQHRYTESLVKFGHVIFEICVRTDRLTDQQTDTYRHADSNRPTSHPARRQSNYVSCWRCLIAIDKLFQHSKPAAARYRANSFPFTTYSFRFRHAHTCSNAERGRGRMSVSRAPEGSASRLQLSVNSLNRTYVGSSFHS